MVLDTSLEYRINTWLDQPVTSNNGNLLVEIENQYFNYLYRDYCDDYFSKIKNIIVSGGNTITNEEEFKDRVIYLLYKYCQK